MFVFFDMIFRQFCPVFAILALIYNMRFFNTSEFFFSLQILNLHEKLTKKCYNLPYIVHPSYLWFCREMTPRAENVSYGENEGNL